MQSSILPAGCAAALFLVLAAAPLRADQLTPSPSVATDPFEALQKALRAEREAARASGGVSGGGRAFYDTSSFLENIRQALSLGDEASALNTLSQLEGMATTPEVRRACEALRDKITKDRTAREQAFAVELDLAIKHAGEVVLQAREPKELDAQIENFSRMAEERSTRYSDGRDMRVGQKIQGILTFLARWQDYLAALANGDDAGAANLMRNLAETGSGHPLPVARSEIVARQNTAHRGETETVGDHNRNIAVTTNSTVADILDGCHTLADIPATLEKLNGIWTKLPGNNYPSTDNSTDLGAAINNLQALQRADAELRTGLATTINISILRGENSNRPAVDSRLAGLRAELVALALPRLLNAPDVKPAPGEKVNEFLHRLVEIAKGRGDWDAVSRGMEIAHSLATGTSPYNSGYQMPSDAFKQFFVGLNMEASGQYEQAVIAFLNALKTGAQDLPTRLIGEHLAAIQKDHPKEFGEANSYVLNPPAPQYPAGMYGPPYGPYPGGRRMMIDPRTGRPALMSDQTEQPTPNPVLTIPAASTPAVSPSPGPTPAASMPTPAAAASRSPEPKPGG